MVNIFLVFDILLLYLRQNMRNSKNIGHIVLGTVRYLMHIFEKFIDTSLEYYGLDPCHYFSSPGLSWDVMLKITAIELELISNIDMYLFIEKGMRGGISYIA